MSRPSTPDPVFTAVSKAIYGDLLDPREVWELAKLDGSDVHSPTTARPRKPKPVDDGHSNTSRALMLGAAAEGLGTFRAGQAAYHAVRKPAAAEVAGEAGHLAAVRSVGGSRAAKVGEFGLQAANLGVGLVAAHKLSQNAKAKRAAELRPRPVPVAKADGRIRAGLRRAQARLRPINQTMTDPQAARHTAALAHATRSGQRAIVGTALVGGAAAGAAAVHHRMKGQPTLPDEDLPQAPAGPPASGRRAPVGKGLRPVATAAALPGGPPALKAGIRPVNTGGPGRGLGRNGHSLGGGATPIAKPVVKWAGVIAKVDEEQRLVFGWASVSEIDGRPVDDRQNDRIAIEEVEKAAYDYVLNSRVGGSMHARVGKGDAGPYQAARLVESFVSTPEKLVKMGLAPDALPHGQWIGLKVDDDDAWGKVKRREYTGLSLHGTGERSDVLV
jgi:hypothetical protein